ncbi:IMP dehydrogenase GMP reductase [Micractinium conductrix]|uniref:IMP dehydrogenase GMP reductase n=1 Tax=Micractinium conductrix TaxID=554055 RepID=A0A2P6VBC5_9CHLO|nr:IMP dehydrogenase GMP reductase [Micractinium conductrix]|eukprot:PSC71397.1 IMP dehydrogenase GMP reductase [Micractinium conductrix]
MAFTRAAQRAPGAAPLLPPAAWGCRRLGSAARGRPNAAASQSDAGSVDLQLPSHCSGCGVPLQQEDPESPGFFQVPRKLLDRLEREARLGGAAAADDDELAEFEEDDSEIVFDDVGPEAYRDAASEGGEAAAAPGEASTSGRASPEDEAKWTAFDSMVEGWLGGSKPRTEVASYSEQEEEGGPANVLCARCYSLRNYGAIKSAAAEAELPEFDFKRKVGGKIQLQKFRRSVVLCVVDVADFDGSLPRGAIRSLLPMDMRDAPVDPSRTLPLGFRLVVAVNKADLLPKQVTPMRLERWVRKRMVQGGLPRPSAVHVVSSTKQRGVRELLADLQAAVGVRGDVWVVGAQNAGKSSLINAMRQAAGLPRERDVTTAPLPGTTLGMLRVPGLLPTGCKMLDTPGVPHAHQLASHLTADEMRMVLPRRPLKPRTFRVGSGQTVMVGGLARVDVLDIPGATIYLNVFASDEIGCHMGKTEGADARYQLHAGTRLTPPLGGAERVAALPPLQPTEVEVGGGSWRESSTDIAVAGLGWVGVGVSGTATLRVWAPPGVAVTTHDALVPDYARDLERPGFGLALTDSGKNKREEAAKAFKDQKAAAAKEAAAATKSPAAIARSATKEARRHEKAARKAALRSAGGGSEDDY